MKYRTTPDGRYFIVRGRLWRMSDPSIDKARREDLTKRLMAARRAVASAKRAGNDDSEKSARQAVEAAKIALGERGPVWWTDGAPNFNRHMAKNTPYADCFASLV